MNRYIVLVSLAGLFITGCAHHRDVRPGVDGVHRVVVQAESDEGQRDAISQANHYCEQSNRSAAFIEEKQTYTGKVDEETYNTGKTVSKVLKTVGSATMVFGGRNEKNIGGVGALAGVGTDAALGKGYTVDMKFKCVN